MMLSHSLVGSYTAVSGEFRSYVIFLLLSVSLENHTTDHAVSNVCEKTRTYSGSTGWGQT